MFTQLPYLYRDASNYKEGSSIYLNGRLTKADIKRLEQKLEGGEGFIPFDLGLDIPELQERLPNFPSEDDHVYHELQFEEVADLTSVPEGAMVIELKDFLAAFDRIADENSWDVAAAEVRLGIGDQFQSDDDDETESSFA